MARRAQSYSCPFCTYTGEKRENAQKHFRRHLKRIAKEAGYVVVKVEPLKETKGPRDFLIHAE